MQQPINLKPNQSPAAVPHQNNVRPQTRQRRSLRPPRSLVPRLGQQANLAARKIRPQSPTKWSNNIVIIIKITTLHPRTRLRTRRAHHAHAPRPRRPRISKRHINEANRHGQSPLPQPTGDIRCRRHGRLIDRSAERRWGRVFFHIVPFATGGAKTYAFEDLFLVEAWRSTCV